MLVLFDLEGDEKTNDQSQRLNDCRPADVLAIHWLELDLSATQRMPKLRQVQRVRARGRRWLVASLDRRPIHPVDNSRTIRDDLCHFHLMHLMTLLNELKTLAELGTSKNA